LRMLRDSTGRMASRSDGSSGGGGSDQVSSSGSSGGRLACVGDSSNSNSSSSSSSSVWDAWAAEDAQRALPPRKMAPAGVAAADAVGASNADATGGHADSAPALAGFEGEVAGHDGVPPPTPAPLDAHETGEPSSSGQERAPEPFAPSAAAARQREQRHDLGLGLGGRRKGAVEQHDDQQQQAEQKELMSNLSSMVGLLKEASVGLGDSVREDAKTLDKTADLTTKNLDAMQKANRKIEALADHGLGMCAALSMIAFAIVTFLGLFVFMRIFKKPLIVIPLAVGD